MSEDKSNDDIIDVEPTIINEAKEEPQRPAKQDPRRLLAAGIALGLICAVLGAWFYRGVLASYLPTDQMQTLSARVDALDTAGKDATKRIDAVIALTDELKGKLGAAQAQADKSAKVSLEDATLAQNTAASVSALQQALEDEKASLESLQAKIGSGGSASASVDPALIARLDALEKSIGEKSIGEKSIGEKSIGGKSMGAMQAAPPAVPGSTKALLQQSVDALKAQVTAGHGFAPEVAAVQKLLPAAEGFDVLNAEAAQGLPNADALLTSLTAIRQNLPKTSPPQASGGWLDSIGGWFSNLVSVKPIGGEDAATVAAKAAAFLASGDLQQAVDSLNAAPGPLPPDLKNWQDTALRRLKVEQALARVSAAAARDIAAKG